jgi:fructan beta-fructosidase
MSLPRELTAVKTPDGSWRLRQRPVKELEAYRLESRVVDAGQLKQPLAITRGAAHEILFRGISSRAGRIELRLSNRCDEKIIIAIDRREQVITVDRQCSSCLLFDEEFPPVVEAGLPSVDGLLDIMVVLDRSVLEIFACQGEVVMTNLFFLTEEIDTLTIEGVSDETGEVAVTPVRSIWKK